MADQIDINELVRQLQSLVPELRKLSGTAGTAAATTTKDTDRLIRAIAQLSVAMNKREGFEKLDIARFTKSVDRAVDAQDKKAQKEAAAAKQIENAAKEEAELRRRAGLTALERVQEDAEKQRKLRNEEAKEKLDNFRTQQREQTNNAKILAGEQLAAARSQGLFGKQIDKMANRVSDRGGDVVNFYKRIQIAGEVLGRLGSVGKGFITFGAALGKGQTNFEQLNPVIDGVVKAFKGIPILGTVVEAAGEGFKFMLGQLQMATETFQKLGAAGALTARGMSGVQEQFLRSGLSLEGFRKAVTDNASTLARFGGTVGRGAEDFSKIVGQILDSEVGDQMRRLGYTADTFGEATAGYLEQQTRLGMSQTRTNAQLAKGAAEYAQQLDALSKITGMQRQEIEKQQQAAMSESRFRAKIDELVAQGRQAEAKALLDLQTMASKASPALAQGLRDLATGNATTEAAQQVLRMGGQEILNQVESGMLGPVDAARLLQQRFKEMAPMMRDLAKAVGDETGAFTKYAEFSDFINAKILDSGEIIIEQNKQMAKGTDGLTDNTISAQKSMEQMSRQIQNFGFKLMPAASTAVRGFTNSLNSFIKGVSKLTGINIPSITAEGVEGTAAATGAPTAAGGAGAPAAAGAAGGGRVFQGGVMGTLESIMTLGKGFGSYGAETAAAPAAGGAATTPAAAGIIVPSQGAGMRPAPTPGAVGSLAQIRELIAGVESRGDYNIVVGGAKYPLTTMTVQEVLALQKQLISSGRDSAAGKYQIKYSTLTDIMGKAGVGLDDKFDQSTQDKLADALIMRRGFNQYASNPTQEGKERFLANLAREWAGLPGGPSGESYYKGTGNNKSGIGWQQALASFQTGGIASGPRSGYTALLHGNEAVVPLPDGKTIPVEMPNLDRSMEQQVGMMGAQLVALEELVRYMRENASISAKILQAAHN